MSIWKTIIFIFILVVLGIGIYNLKTENRDLEVKIDQFTAVLVELESENASLLERIVYFRSPENLLKELKSQFNYREEGEEMIIMVPKSGD